MTNHASGRFWAAYAVLPTDVKRLAKKTYALFRRAPNHPSLRFKKVGPYWSVRVGRGYRALALEVDDGFLWIWIGPHSEYDAILRGR
jgi:hypothetical protein